MSSYAAYIAPSGPAMRAIVRFFLQPTQSLPTEGPSPRQTTQPLTKRNVQPNSSPLDQTVRCLLY